MLYSPVSPLKNFPLFVKSLIIDTYKSRHLAWRLFTRDLSAQYRQSIFGYIWAFIPPLVTALTFIYLEHKKIIAPNIAGSYPLYVLTGTLLWQTFIDAITIPLKVMHTNKTLLTKVNVKKEAIILAASGEIAFSLILKLVVFLAIAPFLGLATAPMQLLVPLGLGTLIALGFSISLCLLPLSVLYTDIQRGLTILLNFAFLLAPITYAPSATQSSNILNSLNLSVPVIVSTRDWILGSTTLGPIVPLAIGSMLLFFIGWTIFKVSIPHLISRIGN